MLTVKVWVMIMTYWGMSLTTQEFTTQANCIKAGTEMIKIKGSKISFVCVPK